MVLYALTLPMFVAQSVREEIDLLAPSRPISAGSSTTNQPYTQVKA